MAKEFLAVMVVLNQGLVYAQAEQFFVHLNPVVLGLGREKINSTICKYYLKPRVINGGKR